MVDWFSLSLFYFVLLNCLSILHPPIYILIWWCLLYIYNQNICGRTTSIQTTQSTKVTSVKINMVNVYCLPDLPCIMWINKIVILLCFQCGQCSSVLSILGLLSVLSCYVHGTGTDLARTGFLAWLYYQCPTKIWKMSMAAGTIWKRR